MLITDETPSLTWTLSDLAGSTWQAGAPFSQLTNGAPRIGVRLFRGVTVGGFELSASWFTASRPQAFAILGLGEEWEGQSFGLSVQNVATGSSTVDLGTVSVVRLPDGSLAAFALIPSLAFDVDTVTITGGTLTGAAYLIGEIVIATAQTWCIRRDWTETVLTLTKENRTITGQPFNVRRPQYRRATVTIAPQVWGRAVSLANVQTLQKLQARLSQNQPVLVFPALRPPGLGADALVETDTAYAAALFGTCSDLGQISLVDGSNLAELKLTFTESPAGRVN
jgi:hypothetical protein